ncbi:hypothetical protein HD806DRAFT_549679 [Xylariaceae sp. AK1471]|nr:hypothetical protein HD806DRAFT_549679 [Xylariaceae sp. AK1471]
MAFASSRPGGSIGRVQKHPKGRSGNGSRKITLQIARNHLDTARDILALGKANRFSWNADKTELLLHDIESCQHSGQFMLFNGGRRRLGPWTVTGYTVSGPDGQEVATFRVTAPDNYVTGVRGLDVLCERVPYGLEWDTVCASNETFRLEVNVSYQESYPEVEFKINHVQIDTSSVTTVTGEDFVLPTDTFQLAVDTVAVGL